MTKAKDPRTALTEFEGALLTDIRRHGVCTAYQVRRTFEDSRSLEWSGSAGAVYPAIKRLIHRGLIVADSEKADGRGTRQLSLSRDGAKALEGWVTDVERAVGPGLDPFRTRSSEWALLPPARRRAMIQRLERALLERVAELKSALAGAGDDCTSRMELDLALQHARLSWLQRQTG